MVHNYFGDLSLINEIMERGMYHLFFDSEYSKYIDELIFMDLCKTKLEDDHEFNLYRDSYLKAKLSIFYEDPVYKRQVFEKLARSGSSDGLDLLFYIFK